MEKATLENLYIENLTWEELQTLLPCYRQDIQKLIEKRIEFLKKNDNLNNLLKSYKHE